MHRSESNNVVDSNEHIALLPEVLPEYLPTRTLSATVHSRKAGLWVTVSGALCVAALVLLAPAASAAIDSPTYPRTCDWDGNCTAPGGHGYGPLIPRPTTGWGVNPGIGGPKPDLCEVYP